MLFYEHLCIFLSHLELVTVIGSDLFSQDEYIKEYLLDPDLPFISKVKIGLRYYVTADLILQLQVLKDHLGIPSFKDFTSFLPIQRKIPRDTFP